MESEIAKRYTDVEYLSKSELIAALKTSLVDGYWKEVLAYRKQYQNPLPLKSIRNKPFYYVKSEPIMKKADDCLSSLGRIVNLYKKGVHQSDTTAMERALLFRSLSGMNKAYGEKSNDLTIKAIINGTYRDNGDGKESELRGYLRTLRYFSSIIPSKPDDSFIGKAYQTLLGVDELSEYYRPGDFDNRASKCTYYADAVFPYAPTSMIEGMMDDFYLFASSSERPLLKALIGMFYIIYVRPFSSKNEEVATLFALDCLSYEAGLGKEGFFLPLSLALIVEPVLNDITFVGAQKAGDLTYYLTRSFALIEEACASLKEELDSILLSRFEEEANALSEEEERKKEQAASDLSHSVEQISLFEQPSEETKASTLLPKAEKVESKPAPAPIKKEPVAPIENKKPVEKTASIPTISKEEVNKANGVELAIKKKDSPLSDKEIKEYIAYLLESNYSLNKSQATFLANHCTIGHYYSIQQYKKCMRCAYETARTSMEKLVNEGYYKKLQVKNKFVYTPVKQNGDE